MMLESVCSEMTVRRWVPIFSGPLGRARSRSRFTSENTGRANWCLQELVQTTEGMECLRHMVLRSHPASCLPKAQVNAPLHLSCLTSLLRHEIGWETAHRIGDFEIGMEGNTGGGGRASGSSSRFQPPTENGDARPSTSTSAMLVKIRE